MVLVAEPENAAPAKPAFGAQIGSVLLERFGLELKEIGGDSEAITDFALAPVSNLRPDFSGELVYTARFDLEKLPARAAFSAQYVFECMELTVNGKRLPLVYVPPYEQEITGALRTGENKIKIRVATTALRNANTKPGIFGKERTILEPTGMFGKIEIKLYE